MDERVTNGRLNKLMNKQHRFANGGVMTMEQYISRVSPEYKTAGDWGYVIWWQNDGRYTGTSVPKIVWDSLDLPSEPQPIHEEEPRRVYSKYVERAALDLINAWYDFPDACMVLLEGDAGGESAPEIAAKAHYHGSYITSWPNLNAFNGMTSEELRCGDDVSFNEAVTLACDRIESAWESYLDGIEW